MSIENIPDDNRCWFDDAEPTHKDYLQPEIEDIEGNEVQNEIQLPQEIAAEIPRVSSWGLRKQQAVIWLKRTRYLAPVVAACGIAWTVRSARSLEEKQKANRER